MKIILSCDAFDSIMKATKSFVCKDKTRPVFTQIKLESTGGKVVATALDGIKVMQLIVIAEKGTENGTILVPWIKPIGKKKVRKTEKLLSCYSSVENPSNCAGLVEIVDTDDSVNVNTFYFSQSFKKVQDTYMDCSKLFYGNATPEATVHFNPKQLAEALSAFACDTVKVECFGELEGCVITDVICEQKAVVLPKCPPQKKDNQTKI